MALARAYEQRDQIPWPIAVDDVEGNLHQALDPKPNAAYIMDKRGNVVFRTLLVERRSGPGRRARGA
jgi:hypothetical protein